MSGTMSSWELGLDRRVDLDFVVDLRIRRPRGISGSTSAVDLDLDLRVKMG